MGAGPKVCCCCIDGKAAELSSSCGSADKEQQVWICLCSVANTERSRKQGLPFQFHANRKNSCQLLHVKRSSCHLPAILLCQEYIITIRCMSCRHLHDDQGCALTCMRIAGAGYHGKLTGPLLVTPQMPCWELQSFMLPRGQRRYGFERRPRSYEHLPRPRSRRFYGLLPCRRLRLLRQHRRLLPRRLLPRCLSRQATRTTKQSSFPAQVPAGRGTVIWLQNPAVLQVKESTHW